MLLRGSIPSMTSKSLQNKMDCWTREWDGWTLSHVIKANRAKCPSQNVGRGCSILSTFSLFESVHNKMEGRKGKSVV